MKKMLMTIALLGLTACDYVEKSELKHERSERVYRSAMDDYRAGRIDLALKGLRHASVADPANASARFQLACLLQDVKKDYIGAYCAYHEYLQQRPDSDKAKLAIDRMVDCERAMASSLAAKYGLNSVQEGQRVVAELREALRKSERRTDKLTKDLQASMQRTMALVQENERLKNYVSAEAEQDANDSTAAKEIAEAKELLSDTDEPRATTTNEIAEVRALLEDTNEEGPLIKQPPDAKARREAAQIAQREAREAEKAEAKVPPHEKRPDVYVVREGDTLYKLALRFYGRSSAWKEIRAANKATISTDGRLRTGQKIVLPAE